MPLNFPAITGQLHLVAGSSPFMEHAFQAGMDCLKELAPELSTNFMFNDDAYCQEPISTYSHLAGSDELRAGFINQALRAPGITMIVRGGFGISRLLDKLEWAEIIKARPMVIGFSDFTALLNPLAKAGLVAMHGPSLTQLPHLDSASLEEFVSFIQGKLNWPRQISGHSIGHGSAMGKLMGGNLSMLCHLMGTRYEPDFNGAILAIEEVNEHPYALDRLITQLELAGVPNKIAGIAVGDLHGWHEELDEEQINTRYNIVAARLKQWGKPLLTDLPFGHAARNRLLPLGAMARIKDNHLHLGL